MASRKRVVRRILAAGVLCVAVAGSTLLEVPRDPVLLEKAHPVKLKSAYPYPYQWFTDQTVLALVPSRRQDKWSTALMDATTGLATPFPLLSVRTPGDFYACRLSPDRKWVLSTNAYRGTANVMSLDGKHRVTRGKELPYPPWTTGEALWMPDSRRWVVLWADRTHLYHEPDDLRWLPGGKQLSFVSQKMLWTVAAAE